MAVSNVLNRRLSHLDARNHGGRTGNSYDLAEISALRTVLGLIEDELEFRPVDGSE